ncbi:MAG: chorismate synthase [Planctomycetota bacterium]
MLEYVTAGESHGAGLHAILTGLPAGLAIDRAFLDAMLRRRQGGYGRSVRQKIEQDKVAFVSGVRRGRSTGNPIALRIRNRARKLAELPPVNRPRPGHADLAGVLKFGHDGDARDVLERSSARETAVRTAVGGLCALLLRDFGIEVFGHVARLGPVKFKRGALDAAVRDRSPFHSLDPEGDRLARKAVDRAAKEGDTLGGVIEVVAAGVPPGLGTNTQASRRIDGCLAAGLLAIPAMKGVEIGLGFATAGRKGSRVHDRIREGKDGRLVRPTNRAGGIEGGMTNGQPVVVRTAMKPLSTLRRSLASVDLKRGGRRDAHFERSDITAVPAAAVVCEAVTAIVLAQAFREKFGGDSLREVRRNVEGYYGQIHDYWTPPA